MNKVRQDWMKTGFVFMLAAVCVILAPAVAETEMEVSGSQTIQKGLIVDPADDVLVVDPIHNRVGVGVDVPQDALDVDGDIRLRGADLKDAAGTSRVILNAGGTLELLEDGGATALTVDTSGKVGIGIASPGEMLDVNGDIRVRGADLKDSGGTTRISIHDNGTLELNDDEGATALSIDTDGKIGIGTSNPEKELHIMPSSGVADFRISHNAIKPNRFIDIMHAGDSSGGIINVEGNNGNPDGISLHLQTDSTTRMTIDSDGKVGIGTANPNEDLTVDGCISLQDDSEPGISLGYAKLYADHSGSTTELFAVGDDGSQTQISSHRDPREIEAGAKSSFADSSEALPFSFHHFNRFTGKGAVVDMAAVVNAVEKLAGKEMTYYYNLPTEQVLDYPSWQENEKARLEEETKNTILAEQPEIEVPIEQVWEDREVTKLVNSSSEVVRFGYDLATQKVYRYTDTVQITKEVGTGTYSRQLKEGIRFDETTGKFYRKRTLDDIEVNDIPEPNLPEWVMNRLPN